MSASRITTASQVGAVPAGVVALSGLVLGGVAAHLARLYVPRWVERYRQDQIEKTRQNNRFPHQCECLTMAFYTAKGRREATGHLRPHHLTGPVGTVLTCPNTGVLLIDVPARERTVRVRGYDESRAVATTPGQYL
ncbi:MAG: hypothetical protein LCH90_20710 [Proteobacteria bacterium]|nr:hypothetical protein [Pseudomonadota bacterium]